jgi:hypothetical protein
VLRKHGTGVNFTQIPGAITHTLCVKFTRDFFSVIFYLLVAAGSHDLQIVVFFSGLAHMSHNSQIDNYPNADSNTQVSNIRFLDTSHPMYSQAYDSICLEWLDSE